MGQLFTKGGKDEKELVTGLQQLNFTIKELSHAVEDALRKN